MSLGQRSHAPDLPTGHDANGVELAAGDAVLFIGDHRDGDTVIVEGATGSVDCLAIRRGATWCRVRLDDTGQLLRKEVDPRVLVKVDEPPASGPLPDDTAAIPTRGARLRTAEIEALCAEIVEGNGTHDCPACNPGRTTRWVGILANGRRCPLCGGWGYL